jgi:hypothetical protein
MSSASERGIVSLDKLSAGTAGGGTAGGFELLHASNSRIPVRISNVFFIPGNFMFLKYTQYRQKHLRFVTG